VSGYGDELLSYLRDNTKLFPTTHREKTFRRKAFSVGIGITSEILNSDRFKQAADDNARAVEFRALIGEFSTRIDADPLVQPVTADEISHALSKRYRFLAFLAEQPVRLTGQARSITVTKVSEILNFASFQAQMLAVDPHTRGWTRHRSSDSQPVLLRPSATQSEPRDYAEIQDAVAMKLSPVVTACRPVTRPAFVGARARE
jgi:hypothetical protein